MTDGEIPCRFGAHCHARVQGVPAPDDGRGLCRACEMRGEHILHEFPHRYRDLATRLGRDTARPPLGQLHTVRAEAPIPLREEVDALLREIHHTLTMWEQPVRDVAHLSDVPDRGVRYQVAVARAAKTLTAHFSVLLALTLTPYVPYGGGVDEADGPGAVLQLSSLYHRVERTLGTTKLRQNRTGRCPNCWLDEVTHHDSTVTSALAWTVGDSEVRCRNCGWTIPLDAYPSYLLAFVPPTARAALR